MQEQKIFQSSNMKDKNRHEMQGSPASIGSLKAIDPP